MLNQWRAPGTVEENIRWERPQSRSAVVDISTGEPVFDPGSASPGSTLLLVDSSASPNAVFATVRQFQHQATLMLAQTSRSFFSGSTTRQRWEHAANRYGLSIANPGEQGWFRLDLSNMGGKLDEIFLPVELPDAGNIIAFPAFPQRNPFDFWRAFAHPHTRLRTEASAFRTQLAVELATGVQADYVFRIASGDPKNPLVIHTDDIVAARLIWLCVDQYLLNDKGREQTNPWEDVQIQTATELGVGVLLSSSLSLKVHSASNLAIAFAQFAAEKLDCLLVQINEES